MEEFCLYITKGFYVGVFSFLIRLKEYNIPVVFGGHPKKQEKSCDFYDFL